MANPAPTINQINAFNATQGTTIDFNIIGGTELIRSNRIYIYDLSDNSLICTHLYVSTESIHELPPNTDGSIVYESGKSSADFVNGAQYYAQIQTYTDTNGAQGGSGLSVAKMFWCLGDPTLTITTIPSTISTTSYNVSATYTDTSASVVSNIIQQYQFNLYSATGSLLQSSGVVVGSGTQQGTSAVYDISHNFTGLNVGSSYYVTVNVTTTQGMSVNAQSNTFTVSIDTPTLGEATVVNNACDGYISVTSNLSGEYGGSGSGEIVSFETDSENVFSKLQVDLEPIQEGSGTPSPSNVRPIRGHSGVTVYDSPTQNAEDGKSYSVDFNVSLTPTSTDTTPYLFKAVGDVYGDRLEDKIVGGTVAWNQLFKSVSVLDASDWRVYDSSKGSISYANGELTYTFSTVGSNPWVNGISSPNFIKNKNHILLITQEIYVPKACDINAVYIQGVIPKPASVGWNRVEAIQKANESHDGEMNYNIFGISNPSASGYEVGDIYKIKNAMLIDLTQMFGSTIADYIYSLEQSQAGAGVAWFKKLFPNDYYAYNAGELLSVEGLQSHDAVGFNQLDMSRTLGTLSSHSQSLKLPLDFTKYYVGLTRNNYYNPSNVSGVTFTDTTVTLTTLSNGYGVAIPMRCFPNTTYYFKASASSANGRIAVGFYDGDGNYISDYDVSYSGSNLFTTPANCRVATLVFSAVANTGSVTFHDICINLSNPARNGEYEPYEKHSYPLDSSLTLRGIPKLDANKNLYYDGDTYEPDGTVTRNKVQINLADLDFVAYPVGSDRTAYAAAGAVTTYGVKTVQTVVPNAFCSNGFIPTYQNASRWNAGEFVFTLAEATLPANSIAFITANGAYASAEAFKTAMANHGIIAELATPTTETATPYTNPQIVSKYGTLEYVTNSIVPVGHKTTYLTRDIFGGYVDLISGKLVVDKVMATLDGSNDESWSIHASGTNLRGYTYALSDIKPHASNIQPTNAICDKIKTGTWNDVFDGIFVFGQTGKAIGFGLDGLGITDSVGLKTWLSNNPITVCYELATPQTYQLTPQQVNTLVGTNNVWSEQGNIELSYHIPITNLLVKRQDVDDVGGGWLTLYSQPITQASDMDFTFIDFLNQYGKTYKYALVPLLTQTQSGVEVEVEGGYTVSNEVQSVFDGVFIADSTGSQKCKANVGYGNVDMNQVVGSITPIGAKYPIIITNSHNQYHNGSISGTIVPDDYYFNGNLSRIDMVNKRNELEQFLTNKRVKVIKDWNGNIWLVMIAGNVSCTFNNNYGMGIVSFSTNWTEVGDPTNQQDLQATGLINVGGV